MSQRGVLAAVVSLAVLWPTGACAESEYDLADRRVPLYYADQTVRDGAADYPVEDTARRWSRNPYVRLVPVESCTPDLDPCVTITESDAVTDLPEADGAWLGWPTGHSEIVLVPRPYMDSIGQGDRFRRYLICHELGHYVLGRWDDAHTVPGCMTGTDITRPTRAGRAAVSPRSA